jgi:cytochrome c-type biogenesis protein CcmH
MALLIVSVSGYAVIEIEPLSTPALEERYRDLLEELRCPKCQNQNLKDSNSPISVDLRREIRQLLEAGKSDDEVVAHLVDRYGEFVRYRPAVADNTWVLWFAPGLLLVLGLVVVVVIIRRRGSVAEENSPLNEDEQRALAALLDNKSVHKQEEQH